MDASGIRAVVAQCRRSIWLFRAVSRNRRRGLEPGTTHADGGVFAMKISVPELSLVLMVGASGCGKSTFARRHFKSTEVLSSDFCRGLVADNENDQTATTDAFAALHFIASRRLARGKLTVVDATNVQMRSEEHTSELQSL